MYCENYRNMSPYSSWYEEISELYRHIKYRLQEIKNNKDYRYGEFYEMRKNEYDRGQEFGLIFDQHCLLEEEIEIDTTKDLIALEAEIKSTLEKVLKSVAQYYNLLNYKQKGLSMLDSYIHIIETGKSINMADYLKEKCSISEMNRNRNRSEHELSSLERVINYEYIDRISNDTYRYGVALIQKLYEQHNVRKQ